MNVYQCIGCDKNFKGGPGACPHCGCLYSWWVEHPMIKAMSLKATLHHSIQLKIQGQCGI